MAARRNHSGSIFERLEDRQLFSAILGPSAVEGDYKGVVTAKSGQTVEVKLILTSTSAEAEYGDKKDKIGLTAKEFEEIRKGTFDYTFTVSGTTVTLDGTVTDSGKRISGSAKAGSTTGTFVLEKYAT
jgi:hypothetical protein